MKKKGMKAKTRVEKDQRRINGLGPKHKEENISCTKCVQDTLNARNFYINNMRMQD